MRHRRAALLLILATIRGAGAQDVPRGMAITPNAMASSAAQQILHAGGTATDAAIAAQMMLSVVEPQESGIGGGSMLLLYSGDTHEVTGWDGRETAPAGVKAALSTAANGTPGPVTGGRSVGTPGTVRMLEELYRERGRLPWADLLAPAIQAAEAGVPVSNALADAIAANAERLRRSATARALFFTPEGAPLAAGATLVNPALGQTLRAIATGGAKALLHGPIAADIATTVRGDAEPGLLTTDDLAAYAARKRAPDCLAYRQRTVCAASAPAAGLQMLETLGLLRHFELGALDPAGLDAAHLLIEAERLALADRARFLADPDFVHLPLPGMLAADYLTARAQHVDVDHAADAARAGNPAWSGADAPPAAPAQADRGTSTIAVTDAAGDVVCLTSSLGGPFGSYLLVRGFLLNAALADFATRPEVNGRPVANRMQPGKRPATSMIPTFVLARDGTLVAALGSAGGSFIPAYIAQGVVGLVDWGLSPASALALPHVAGTAAGAEAEAPNLIAGLMARGHRITQRAMPSGSAAIVLQPALAGAADKRGDGTVASD